MNKNILVTGANGHLGQHVVKQLCQKGYQVKAGQRRISPNNSTISNPENCYVEMLDPSSINKAIKGVDVVIHCAAVFKHWAKDPKKEIIDANVEGTRNILKACAEHKVERLIYVSSVAAVGHQNGLYLNEESWNKSTNNAYYQSKIASEKLAWELSDQYQLEMISVLPSAMIGPLNGRYTDTMNFVHDIYQNRLPINPNFHFNFVDVRDVANGIINAINKGTAGERYILANRDCSSLTEIISGTKASGRNIRKPISIPRRLLKVIAFGAELIAKLTGKPAQLTRSQVSLFWGVRQNYDNNKAIGALDFKPRPSQQTLKETFEFFSNHPPIQAN